MMKLFSIVLAVTIGAGIIAFLFLFEAPIPYAPFSAMPLQWMSISAVAFALAYQAQKNRREFTPLTALNAHPHIPETALSGILPRVEGKGRDPMIIDGKFGRSYGPKEAIRHVNRLLKRTLTLNQVTRRNLNPAEARASIVPVLLDDS